MKLEELKWSKKDPFITRARIFFPNGYGVSVISGLYAYGEEGKPFEVCLLEGNESKNFLVNEPTGFLTGDEVEEYLDKIKALPKKRKLLSSNCCQK